MRELGHEPTPPYYLAYEVTLRRELTIGASLGALVASDDDVQRTLDVDLRVGSYEVDNTRRLRGERRGLLVGYESSSAALPLDDDGAAIRAAIWLATDRRYKSALAELVKVKANQAIMVAREDDSPDFSREPVFTYVEPPSRLEVHVSEWQERLREYSRAFRDQADIQFSQVQLEAEAQTRGFVSSEGSLVQTAGSHAQIRILASTTADDGMELSRSESLDAPSVDELPDPNVVRERVARVMTDLRALRRAPLATPYLGPAILEGRAAGVFFHEIFGHRVEGHRQKDEEEGQTFTRQLGERIMPPFIDVYDDPNLESLAGEHLNGYYRYDDEGMRAARATLVDGGVFRGFLMSRSPVRGFAHSNGHGRREEGYAVVSRQGNLVVQPRLAMSPAALKQQLLALVARQGLAYGLRFTVVEGGFTTTQRQMAQAFKVLPVMVYRVYPDGHEELVRGVDLEGTPLTALSHIVAAGDDYKVFNGFCGAESGYVPVAGVSPSLLLGQVEIARRGKGQERPPILPPPPLAPSVKKTQPGQRGSP
jgi:TldD protein